MIRRSLLIRVTVALATVLVLSAAGWFLLPAVAPLPADLLDISRLVSTRIVDADGKKSLGLI